MSNCPKCASEIESDASYCSVCGSELIDPDGDVTIDLTESDACSEPNSGSDSHHGRFLPGSMLGTRYRIVGLLGSGGMGEVYRADDLELGQSVALKFLPADLATDPSALQRLRSEVKTARQVVHPNVCQIYDITEIDGHVFLTMEYVDGGDIAQVLQRLGRPGREKAAEIARQLCLGLASAHENGILHRDLKPANIMLDGRGRVRITDFGLAGLASELATTREIAGTPAYMAPEQLKSGEVSIRSDIFSLGLLLYEIFTGKRAFEGKTRDEILQARATGTPSSMSTVLEDVDPAVERVVNRCLEPDPEDRPSSVYEVLGALPGGDPLAAAVAAGETPSPQLLAVARDKGGLAPKWVALLLVAAVAGSLGIAALNAGMVLFPADDAHILAVKAEAVLEDLGFTDLPEFGAGSFMAEPRAEDRMYRDRLNRQQILDLEGRPYRYWWRWAPRPLESTDFHSPEAIQLDDPPRDSAGEISVVVDDTGRLIELRAIPTASAGASESPGFDWIVALELAGFDHGSLSPIDPPLPVPPYCDSASAWRTPGEEGGQLIVQAGSFHGRPVYFEVVVESAIDDAAGGGEDGSSRLGVTIFRLVVWIVAIVLAGRNIRLGRGDRRAAFRFAMVMACAYFLIETFSLLIRGGIGVGHLGEIFWGRAGGHIVLHAAQVWIGYLAIEPYARRIWPRMLIGWVRFISGNFRNPTVGREILIGVVCGLAISASYNVIFFVGEHLGADFSPSLVSQWDLWMLTGWGQQLVRVLYSVTNPMLTIMTVTVILLAIRLVVRKEIPAAIVATLLFGSGMFFGLLEVVETPVLLAVISVAMGATMVIVYTRVGLLAAFAGMLAANIGEFPLSLDVKAWYGGYSIFGLSLLIGVAVWAGWVALAGQPLFKDILDEK